MHELDQDVLSNITYVENTGSQMTPRGIDLLHRMPSEKYQFKLQKVWNWCKRMAAEHAASRHPAAQPSTHPAVQLSRHEAAQPSSHSSPRPAQKAKPKPPSHSPPGELENAKLL